MKMKKLFWETIFPILLVFFLPLSSFAQSKTVTGKVISQTSNSPLSGVTVLVKGTKTGTSTDNSGNFSITVPSGNAVLVFSSVGFAPQEIAVGSQSVFDVKLADVTDKLADIVVVGYGTQKKREVTSAITRIDAEQFNKGNISDVSQLLQGKVAGLSIAKPGGDPNGGFTIRLRGLSTIGANTSPLVVIDGQVGADINTVDPNDIKSIDVLKDGSSAAIYGTRGSAGVIIITTKSGVRSGPPQASYNGGLTVENVERRTKVMSAEQYRNQIKSGGNGGNDFGASTDWYKAISQTALTHTHNFSLAGGSGGTSYNASINYRNGQGIAITTGFQQLSGNLNLTQKALNDKLVVNVSLNGTKRSSQLGDPAAFSYAATFNPTAPIHTPIGSSADIAGGGWFELVATSLGNPVADLLQNSNTVQLTRNNIAVSGEYEIAHGLKFLTRYAQQNTISNIDNYSPINAYSQGGFNRHGLKTLQEDVSNNQLYENTLSYSKRVSNLDVSAIAGYSWQQFTNNGSYEQEGDFVTDAASGNIAAALDVPYGIGTIKSYKNANVLVAFFGRVNLNYKDLAFLAASVRREGSTEFGPNEKYGTFPAVSGGVDLSKLIKSPGITNLKIRASYGQTGSLPPYAYLSLPTLTISGSYYAGNNQFGYTYAPNQNPNPNLKWETKAETDIGTDFGFFGNKLTGTIDYYNRTTSNLIYNANVPVPPNLVSTTWLNIGTLTSSGIEVALNYDLVKKRKFGWTTGINFASSHVLLKSLNPALAGSYVGASNLGSPGQEATQITRNVVGQQIGLFWGPVYKGLDHTGNYLFDDGKGGTTNSTAYQTIIGHGLPKFNLGWTNNFHYGNWDLNIFFRGTFGHDLINTYRAFYENPTVVSTNYNIVNTKYFNPKISQQQEFSSLFVEKGDFVKLDNATIAYNIPLKEKPGGTRVVRSLRASLTGYNLFIITKYTGADPEVRYQDTYTNPPNILAPGIDRREAWVLTRSFTLGLNIGF